MLIGTQGLGKSTLLRTLTGDAWFGDTDLPLSNKDSYIMLARAWIYEIAELTSFKRADADKVKAFITSQVDSFRKPFERKTIDYPRHTCIVASSNNETPLNDPTGSRRFWPVYMHEYADLTWLKANREQLWAEAREAYKAGEVWHLSREMEKEQQRLAEERFTEEDPVKGVLVRWIERPGHETFTLTDIYQKALAGASASSNRITRLLKELGAAPLKQSRENRLRIRYWLKPGSALPEGHEYRDLDTAQRHIRTLNNVIPLAPVSSLD
jgi:predicted P-loop ATPase